MKTSVFYAHQTEIGKEYSSLEGIKVLILDKKPTSVIARHYIRGYGFQKVALPLTHLLRGEAAITKATKGQEGK